jgi:hypothetical protein
MNTYTKMAGGGVSDLALVAPAFRPASLALLRTEKSLRRLSRLRDGLRQQGTGAFLWVPHPSVSRVRFFHGSDPEGETVHAPKACTAPESARKRMPG